MKKTVDSYGLPGIGQEEVQEKEAKTPKKLDRPRKRFVRSAEGAELYSMGRDKFMQLAKEANAIYKLDRMVLVNCDLFEAYLDTFRVVNY